MKGERHPTCGLELNPGRSSERRTCYLGATKPHISPHESGVMEGAKPFYSNSLNPNKRINGGIYNGVSLKSDTSHHYKLCVGNHNKYSNTIGTLNQIDQFENEHIP